MTQIAEDISVIICAYTEDRWNELIAAIESLRHQTIPPREIIVVIDNNLSLLKRVQEQVPDVISIENREAKGASGARNSGANIAQGSVLAFLDDDAIANPNWIERLGDCYTNSQVIGAGGKIEPLWRGVRPSWFPEEFNWVIGCTYRGMPMENSQVRNVIGANMSVRRHIMMAVGGFRESFGNNKGRNFTKSRLKWFQHHAGDEETEFCIRVAQQWPESTWLYTNSATVQHCVSEQRTRLSYFLWRCYDEGLGKALLVKLHGTHIGLSSERTYAFKTLPRGVLCGLTDALTHFDLTGLARAGAIVSGLTATTTGYLMGRVFSRIVAPRSSFGMEGDVLHNCKIGFIDKVQS